MSDPEEIESLLIAIFDQDSLLSATLSSPRKPAIASKVAIRPIVTKERALFQVTENIEQKALHQNLSKTDCLAWLKGHIVLYKQTFLYTVSADYHLLTGKKGNLTLLKKPPSKSSQRMIHNRQKEYLWKEGTPVPFLIYLGVMNQEGKVYAAKQFKFRQINRFLEMIEDVMDHFDPVQPLHIVDFGCGKAYLTFALYHFLKETKGYSLKMVGVDLKNDVIVECNKISQALGYGQDLQFIHGDINVFQPKENVDMVVSLHACDTATDAALERAIRWQAKVILAAPCCQHELLSQIQQDYLRPLLKHGILKERFAALATDAARLQLLEVLGYQTQIIEFIEVEHTPKNLLIRAVKTPSSKNHQKKVWEEYLQFKQTLHIHPSLERRFPDLSN
jgi:SAM-dependent methyltransferase